MEFFRIRRDIPFMKHALLFNVISLVTFVLAVFFLATRGLYFSVEFTGGTEMEVRYPEGDVSTIPDVGNVRATVTNAGFSDALVQTFGGPRDIMIRLRADTKVPGAKQVQSVYNGLTASPVAGEVAQCVDLHALERKVADATDADSDAAKAEAESLAKMKKSLDRKCLELRRVDFVGPQVGEELATNGALALLAVSIGIVLYLWLRFEWKFGIAAIIANLHDVVIILGFFAFFQWEFSLSVLAAVLAVLGYSVNESVVVFDRIRENFRKMRKASVTEVINNAITRTISRTIITHGCTQLMVCSMLAFGGATLFYFALALTIGICFGIYSSVLVASPIVMWLGVSRQDLMPPSAPTAKERNQEGIV